MSNGISSERKSSGSASGLDSLIPELGSNVVEFIDVRLVYKSDKTNREEIIGINVSKIEEILQMPPADKIASIPGAAKSQIGVANIRNKVIPIMDLGEFLGMEPCTSDDYKDHVLVITQFCGLVLGFVVNYVQRIRRVKWSDIKPIEGIASSGEGSRSVVGTIILPETNEIMLIVDLEAIAEKLGFFTDQLNAEVPKIAAAEDKTIVVVDDSSSARKIISTYVRKAGFKVIEATDGVEGFDKIMAAVKSGIQISLVLSDVEMPRLDGYSLVKKLKESQVLASIPVILQSSMSGKANIKKGMDSGAVDYITKFNPEAITQAISKYATV